MTDSQSAPRGGRIAARIWLGFIVLIAAALALAWAGAGQMRANVSQSGLEFQVVSEGEGDPIGPQDAALLDYVLTSDDGQVIDSSEKHGGPQPFAQEMVFPGFAEAMGKMRKGGEYKFSFPPRLAFGDGPLPPGFPAGTNLNFQVKVREIAKNGAAMMRTAPPPAQ